MGGSCVCCGYNRCPEALEFHHLDPTQKDFSFGAIRANPRSWSKIVEELRKCVLVCCLCHREVHARVREIPVDAKRFDETYVDYQIKTIAHLTDPCPICFEPKPTFRKTCSYKCSGTLTGRQRGKMRWKDIELETLLNTKSMGQVAEELKCSHTAVWKEARKRGITTKRVSIWNGIDLKSLMESHSMNKISKLVGCSEMAVRKRVQKENLTHLIRYNNKGPSQ